MTKRKETGVRAPVLSRKDALEKVGEHEEMRKLLFGNGEEGLRAIAQDTAEKVGRLVDIVDGNPDKDIKGLRPRMASMEASMERLLEDRRRVKWVLAGLGLTGAANVGLLATAIKVVFFPSG